MRSRICGILLGLAVLCGVGRSACAQADLNDQLKHDYMVMSRYYLFVRDDASSDVLHISLNQGNGYPHVIFISQITTWTDVYIWWPGLDRQKISQNDIITSAILPAVCTSTTHISRAEKNAHAICTALMNPKEKRTKERYADLTKKYGQQEVFKKLADQEEPSFQLIEINETALARIRKLYPKLPAPLGIHLRYWRDPSLYTFKEVPVTHRIEYWTNPK